MCNGMSSNPTKMSDGHINIWTYIHPQRCQCPLGTTDAVGSAKPLDSPRGANSPNATTGANGPNTLRGSNTSLEAPWCNLGWQQPMTTSNM